MLAGQRAFRGDSAADTMSAILKEDPPDITLTNQNVPPGIERIVRHCLEKNPEQRFQSARDLAFDLEALSGVSGASSLPAPASTIAARRPRGMLLAGGLALLLAVGLASFFAGRRVGASGTRDVKFTPLTYRSLPVFRALFAPDGRTVILSQALEGNRPEIFTLAPEYPEPRPLGVTDAQLLSVSSKGELALLTHARYIHHRLFIGTLSRMPLGGGAPREVVEGVREADWAPDGQSLAIIRTVDGKDRLEYPIGKVLYATGGYVSDVRFSPRGDRIAFLEHPYQWDDRGGVAVVDLSGKKTDLAGGYGGVEGLAWSPDGNDVLYSAGISWSSMEVHSVSLAGKDRVALGSGGGLTLFDISRAGRWLGAREDVIYRLMVMAPGAKAERDLSWLDASKPVALSHDGRTLLLSDFSSNAGENYAVCLRKTDGSPVVRLGEGTAWDLSPDGLWALGAVPSSPSSPSRLMLYPTGAGESRRLESGPIREHASGTWFPDGKRILVCGTDDKRTSRCYIQEIGGAPRPVTADGDRLGFVSPDGKQLLVQGNENRYRIYSADVSGTGSGGEGRPVSALTPADVVSRWTSDGRGALVYHQSEVPGRLERVDFATGRRELVRTLAPPDLAGVVRIYAGVVADDENVYAYNAFTRRADLLFVDGAR
jgi:Tol biopolymer transport system component